MVINYRSYQISKNFLYMFFLCKLQMIIFLQKKKKKSW